MTRLEEPTDLAGIVGFINQTETPTLQFLQVKALDNDAENRNEFTYSEESSPTSRLPINVQAVDDSLSTSQVANIVATIREGGAEPVCFSRVNVTAGSCRAIFFRSPGSHGAPDAAGFMFTKASVFGLNMDGTPDPEDNGIGAWGDVTTNPSLVGAAIPKSVAIAHFGTFAATRHQKIEVTRLANDLSIVAPIVDLGPKEGPNSPVSKGVALDLTLAAQKALGGNGMIEVKYRFVSQSVTAIANAVAAVAADGVKDVNAAIYQSALANNGKLDSSKIAGTEHGNLGCAWAVNEVVRQALGHKIGGGLSTDGLYDSLKGGKARETKITKATRGSIIISPSQGETHGHVGIVGEKKLIYSNRSADGIFSQNYNFDSWMARYKSKLGLEVLFYDLIS